MKDQDRLLHEIDIEQELEYEHLLDERDVNEDEEIWWRSEELCAD
jgi:hypothetical protein